MVLHSINIIALVFTLTQVAAARPATAPPWIDAHVHTSASHYGPLLDLVGSYGVSRIVNLSGGYGAKLRKSLMAASRYEPQIAVCTSPDWSQLSRRDFGRQQAKLIRQAHSMGAKCLKISKALGLYLTVKYLDGSEKLLAVDSERLDPIWQAAGEMGMPVFIHTGDPKAFFEPPTVDNERYDELSLHPDWSFHGPQFPSRRALLAARNRVFAKHPKTQFVGVHFANNPENIAAVDEVLDAHPNVVVDLAARVPELGRHDPERIRAFFIKHQKRILFGTDLGFSSRQIMLGSVGRERPQLHDIFEFYAHHEAWLETNAKEIPHPTPIQGRWTIDGANIPTAVLEDVYWRNALRIIWKTTASREEETQRLNGNSGMSVYFPD